MDNKKFLIIGGGVFLVFIIIVLIVVLGGKKPVATPTTLTFWNLNEDNSQYQSVISTFQKANPSVTINYVQKTDKDYLNAVLNAVASGKGPDIVAMPNDWLAKYHSLLAPMSKNKLAAPATKKTDAQVYEETFVKAVSQDNIISNQIYGMPLSIDTLELYLNQTLIDDALTNYKKTPAGQTDQTISKIANNGPTTWDDLVKLVQIITQNSGSSFQSGIALGSTDNIRVANDILTLMMLQNGTKMTNPDNTAALFHTDQNNFDNGISFPGTEALKFYTSFADPKNPNYAWQDSLGSSVDAFANGKTAMMIDYHSQEAEVKRLNPDLNFTTTQIPQVKATKNPIDFASYNTFSVSRNSQNSSLAWDFIIQMTNLENSKNYSDLTKKQSPFINTSDPTNPVNLAATWYKPDPQKANDTFQNMIKQVNSGTVPQTAIEGAAAEITNLLGLISQ